MEKISFVRYILKAQEEAKHKVEFNPSSQKSFTNAEVREIVQRVFQDGYIRCLNDLKNDKVVSF